jgi:hypothetical protein
MIKLIDILKEINEGKQVGTLYHFTSLNGLYGILKNGFIKPNSENQISTTRNTNVDTSSFFEYSGGQVTVMLTLDGNKISNKYKVKPFRHDPTFWDLPVYQDKFEFEEQIVTNGKNFPIFPYLKNVSITIDNKHNLNKEILSQTIELLKEKNISYEIK